MDKYMKEYSNQCIFHFSDDGRCLSSLGDTEWLSQISELLETATQVVVAMENDQSSVLIGYEDGMDRTAQVRDMSSSFMTDAGW